MATARATGSCKALAGALLAFFSLCALAGPEEDYRAAMTAYRGGDMTGAMTTLRRTAQQGFTPAAAEPARAYTAGDYGVAPDPAEAARWQPKSSAASKAGPTKGGR